MILERKFGNSRSSPFYHRDTCTNLSLNHVNFDMQCHPTVTKNLNTKFHGWLAKWATTNVADVQHRLCQDWLLGRYENLIPHRTQVITDNDQTRSPYRPYNRYRVERLQSDTHTEPSA